ncbi:hypothetical protein K144316041_p20220 (plasmid) [Clostridium tetani]|uniref:phage morphogenesis protein n=1 Tax=Clostridium tetani TaxID=1513 RepID=UPI002955DA2F|nr:phage morphogenesis protein [Clostridium tetani]BDR74183.1 hypothetical protein K144316041_p20220 [Clostridium tetani]
MKIKLDSNNAKRSTLKAQFNSLEINKQDPTILRGTVIIHDFEKSGNNQVITEEVCAENMNTLIGKRIVCKYIPSENNNGTDALTDHEESEGKDREGNDIVVTNTVAIGFIENVYINDYIDESGNSKRVLFGDVVIWNDEKYSNITGLLQEWLDRGIQVHMSVEYLYCNYNVVEGIEYLQSPIIYVAHTLLNSEQRGEYAEVLPAYDCASLISLNEKKQWNKTINQLNQFKNKKNNSKSKEDNNMPKKEMFKKVCELSHDDIRSQIYNCLKGLMTEDEYYDAYITECYDNYFIVSDWSGDTHKYIKAVYTKTDTTVTVDWENKVEVALYQEWREIPEVQSALKELNSKVDTLEKEKNKVQTKLNEATDKITSLNSKVEELKPIVEEHNKEKYEKVLNKKKSFYEEKFKAVNALEKFKEDEVQELIKKTVDEDEKAIMSLNSMIIDLVKPVEEKMRKENEPIKEMSSKRENLIPANSFENRYFE